MTTSHNSAPCQKCGRVIGRLGNHVYPHKDEAGLQCKGWRRPIPEPTPADRPSKSGRPAPRRR